MTKEIIVGVSITLIGTFVLAITWWALSKLKTIYSIYNFKRKAKGIEFDGLFYAWQGPGIDKMKIGESFITPEGLTDALRNINLIPSYGSNDKKRIYELKMNGRMQVYLIDGLEKRALQDGPDLLLFVRPE